MVNFLGLSVVFTCLVLSAGYIKREFSFDRHHTNADRIVRLTLQFDNEPVDGRIWGNSIDDILQQMPEIDRVAKIHQTQTALLTYQGENRFISDVLVVNRDFLDVFDVPLLWGNRNETRNQALISESFARQLFGELNVDDIQMSDIHLESRGFIGAVFVTGIFEDIPETSHFQADMLLYLPEEAPIHKFVYLLLKNQTNTNTLAQRITRLIEERELFAPAQPRALLMPLTDIHLHSRNLRELSINGSIHHIYLLVGANALLLIVVLFNLWLNTSLIFSYSRRYYQLLRLYGAPSSVVFKDEVLSALILGAASIAAGIIATFYILSTGFLCGQISFIEKTILSLLFLLLIVAVSLLPALKSISNTLFLSTNIDLKPTRFSYSNAKYVLTAQYAIVMIVVILAFGINRQMNLIKNTQIGGNESSILVLTEQPERIQERFELLRSELLRHTEIKAVTTSFQLPGDAIRDAVFVKRNDNTDGQTLPVLAVGEDFLQFFGIRTIAGRGFFPKQFDYQTEHAMFFDRILYHNHSDHIEEYIINRRALTMLGFTTPEEAIGQTLQIEHEAIDYFRRGVIVGVTDDFNYTGLHETTIPLLIMQRHLSQHNIMVRLDPNRFEQARTVFERVWSEVNPGFSTDYVFMNDIFERVYRNEINAQQLVAIFALLCLLIANLGLIVFVAFIIRRRTKEIGIRKIHGASTSQIIRMLNMDFIRYIALAFVIAIPVAWYVMTRWLEQFAYRISLEWWIFGLAGLSVLLVSIASVSLQSWRAAVSNPVEAIKIQ